METVAIRSAALAATVSPLGAELTSLDLADGTPLLWDGDPAFWAGRSPLLFPVVGRVRDDFVVHRGGRHPMPSHGFARRSRFEPVEATPSACAFALGDDEGTRRSYPFAFRLVVAYRLEGAGLEVTATVANPGVEALPVSFGFHPAFRWPLAPGTGREAHVIEFERDEPDPILRAREGLMIEEPSPTPVEGRVLRLSDDLFEDGAVVMDRHRSRSLVYRGPGAGPELRVSFPDLPHLGIWTKPGAGFVCIEPWQGHASPEGFDGELLDKPGIVRVEPEESRSWRMRVEVRRPPQTARPA